MTAEAVAPVVVGVAYLYLAVISACLVVIDVRTHRLPNRIVLPGYLVGVALFAIAAMLGSDAGRFWRAVGGMLILFTCYFVVRMISPGALGGGDVKLAGVLGLYLGWVGWDALLSGTIIAFLIGGVHALVLLALRRADRRTRIAFGPAMIAGAWVALAIAALSAF